ncbi:MAG: hypothetical protein A2749_00300 [Parcubacteria group bacterium RIFCSPHIGHO2_01_FULL_45_26]|nr:MAG: hypothetical protein A2749_00300 [Parcubacteria group bacterium RIFCSPHIGHO2_01_FULL_45_26]
MKLEEMKIEEQMMTPEQRLAYNLQKKVLSDNFETPESASEQQKSDVEKETGDVARILNGYGKPWFLGGGTSLELAQGEITRDHHDSDIVMPYEDVSDFFDYASGLGYKFTDTEGKDILSKEDLVNSRENAFLHKTDKTKPGSQGFEIIFLRKNDAGEILFGSGDEGLAFPTTLYENRQKYSARNGQEVPLQPREVVLLHKIFDGRQKDFHDIKKFLPTLSVEERQRLDGYIQKIGLYFVVGGKETENIDGLMQLAEATTKEVKENFLASKLDEAISKSSERFNTIIGKVFEIANRVSSPENFLDKVKNEFGEDLVAQRKAEFDEVAKFLFGEKKPTQEEFGEFAHRTFNIQKYLEEKMKSEALDMQRWEVRNKSEKATK